jgi:hypothetical protein
MRIKLSDVQAPQTGRQIGQFIRPGINELKITDIVLKKSSNNDSYSPIFVCETHPIEAEGWVGVDGARGQIGKISANQGYYIKNEDSLRKFLGFIKDVGTALDKADELDAIEFETLPELIDKLRPVFVSDTFARYFVCAEEYPKQNGKPGLKLSFPNRQGVEGVNVTPSTLPVFDGNNRYHYKTMTVATHTNPVAFSGFTSTKPTLAEDGLPF